MGVARDAMPRPPGWRVCRGQAVRRGRINCIVWPLWWAWWATASLSASASSRLRQEFAVPALPGAGRVSIAAGRRNPLTAWMAIRAVACCY